MGRVVEGQLNASGMRFGIVVSRFNGLITEQLLKGAEETIVRHGGSRNDISTIKVPGSMEIPLACKKLAESGSVDAVVALGAVIRGETAHFDYICSETARGIMEAGLSAMIPVTFGVITCETLDQAFARSGSKVGNKGSEAALAAIEMASVMRDLNRERNT